MNNVCLCRFKFINRSFLPGIPLSGKFWLWFIQIAISKHFSYVHIECMLLHIEGILMAIECFCDARLCDILTDAYWSVYARLLVVSMDWIFKLVITINNIWFKDFLSSKTKCGNDMYFTNRVWVRFLIFSK